MSKEIIADRLRKARENADVTQKEAAEALGVTLQAISSYERAVTRIDVESLGALCALYGVSVDSIVNGTPVVTAAAARFDPVTLTDEAREMYLNLVQMLAEKYTKGNS